ncbi:hypothetical protein ABPG74_006509 [Tetrahymena malaccensis]
MAEEWLPKVQSGFKKIDLFGKPIGLNYKNQDKFQTVFGGIITILMIIVLCLFFQKNISQFLNKEEIKVSYVQDYSSNPNKLVLDLNKFMFAIQITQKNFISRPLFEVYLENRHYQRFDNGTQGQIRQQLMMEPCTLSHWANIGSDFDWNTTYQQLGFQDWLCPKRNQTIILGGDYTSTDFYFLKISINKCDPAKVQKEFTPQSTCASQDEIQSILNQRGGTAVCSIYFSNKIVNPQNYNPVSNYLSDETFFNFQPTQLYTSANIFFQQVEIDTDESLMPQQDIDENVFPYYSPRDFREQFEAGSPDQYAVFYFRRSSISNTYKRSFQKIDDLISYIGGFFQAILMVLGFIVGYYNEWVFIVDIANRLYNFKQKEKKKSIIQRQDEINRLLEEQNKNSHNNIVNQNKSFSQNAHNESNAQNMRANSKKSSLRAEDIRNIIKKRSKTIKMSLNSNLGKRLSQIYQNPQINEANSKLSQISEINSPFKQQQRNLNLPIIQESDNDLGTQKQLCINPTNNVLIGQQFDINRCNNSKNSDLKQQNNSFKQDNFTEENINMNNTLKFQTLKDSNNSLIHYQLHSKQENALVIELQKNSQKIDSSNLFDAKSDEQKQVKGNQTNHTELKQISNEIHTQIQMHDATPNSLLEAQEQEKITKGFQFKSRKSFLMSQFEDILQRQQGVVLGARFFVNKLFFGLLFQSDENELIEKSAQLVSKDLDIYEILYKLQEVEKMKRILFDSQQLILFNFFPKPEIGGEAQEDFVNRDSLINQYQKKKKQSNASINQKTQNKSNKAVSNALIALSRMKRGINKMRRSSFSDIKAYKRLYEAYEFIVEDQNLNKIDMNKRLIKLLGKEMEDIFNTSKLLKFNEDDQSPNLYQDQRRKGMIGQNKQKTFKRGKTFADVIVASDPDESNEDQLGQEQDISDSQIEEGYNQNLDENNLNKIHSCNSFQIKFNNHSKQEIPVKKDLQIEQQLNDSVQREVPSEDPDKNKQPQIKCQNHAIFDQHIFKNYSSRTINLNISDCNKLS